MDLKHKLSNSLTRKIQNFSIENLVEVSALLNASESKIKSKEVTLRLAGSWSELDDEN